MRVAVSGYYGFGNTGDEAIALAITRELRRLGHIPLLLSATPDQSALTYGSDSAPRMHPVGLPAALARSGALLSGGGGLLQDKTSARTLSYYLGVMGLAKAMRKKVVVFNQSVGPLSEAGGARVAKALTGVRVIVRDRLSLETLAKLGIQAELGGDPALLLEPSAGLIPDPNTVVLAPRGDQTGATKKLELLADRLRAEGRNVIALSFMPGHDDAAARTLSDQVVSTSDPQLALDTIAQAGYVVGVRLHAVILAAAAGVPFAGVSYDPKVQGFCMDAGAPSVDLDFDVQQLADLVLARQGADWAQVEAMKARARESFTRALGE